MNSKVPEVADLIIPDNIKAARTANQHKMRDAEKLFGHDINELSIFGDRKFKNTYSPAMRLAIVAELQNMVADVGMSVEDFHVFSDICRQVEEVPTEETRVAWREEAVLRLNDSYGTDAAQALRNTRDFIAEDPRRSLILEANGIGDHPDVVLLFAKLAKQSRIAAENIG